MEDVDHIVEELNRVIHEERPDVIKERYEKVMIEAGLMKDPDAPKIWIPKK
jgi:hypothetical protein